MIVSWMLYVLLVSACVALAASALDAAARALRLPSRHLWALALAVVVALAASGAWRARAGAPPIEVRLSEKPAAKQEKAPRPSLAAAWLSVAREEVARVGAEAGAAGSGAGGALGAGWALLTLAVLASGGLTLRRFARLRRRWPQLTIAELPVRVAPSAGPAVIGVLHPEIVVPEWLLQRPGQEQRMVVLHEAEHIRGADPLLAGVGFALAALLAWNPLMWWLLRRMRWAAEVDCDGRVLRHDVPTRAYGALLIEMAGRNPRLSLGVSHLSESSSSLERRLHAMTARMPRWARARAATLAAVSALAVLAACEARMPTAAEIDALDARGAESTARGMHLTGLGDHITYMVDGQTVTAEAALAIPADAIERLDVNKTSNGDGMVTIYTRSYAANNTLPPSGAPQRAQAVVRANADAAMVFINGQRADQAALRALNPDDIQGVEVIKGAPAVRMFNDPAAAAGVIKVTTRTPRTQ